MKENYFFSQINDQKINIHFQKHNERDHSHSGNRQQQFHVHPWKSMQESSIKFKIGSNRTKIQVKTDQTNFHAIK